MPMEGNSDRKFASAPVTRIAVLVSDGLGLFVLVGFEWLE